MIRITFIGTALVLLSLTGCEKESDSPVQPGQSGNSGTNTSRDWSIPKANVYDGGPGKDGIPALTEPDMIPANDADYINDNDLVLGYVQGNDARAYPHSILDWHEIINDAVGNSDIAVTYCPLTGTGIGWNRMINGNVTTFGVSGLLYNSNLIPYDRESDSNWSQIRLDCVNGKLKGTEIETEALVETTWKTWKEMYPQTKVVSERTGYSRSYGNFPYRDYRTNHDFLIFPVSNSDSRIESKVRVHGIVRLGNAKIYPLSSFGDNVRVIHDEFEQEQYVIVGNGTDNFIMSFLRNPGDDSNHTFAAVQDRYPIVMSDDEGNMWDVFGLAVSGPRKGTQLVHARSFMGYWFSFAAFYPDLALFGD
jgi:hypothetical protein